MAVLKAWAENFSNRKPTDFVFPSEIYRQGKKGEEASFTIDPTKHVTSVRTA